ncbi:MAG: metallophosphoesterase [Bdellovibrionales bacterium]|nr:metallophosphoesterase [Bdellovibrionales bacterium]
MGLFRAIVLILFSGLFFYSAHQLTRFADLPFLANAAVLLFLALVFGAVLALPLYFWAQDRNDHKPWHDTFFRLTHICIGYVNFLMVFIILRDLAAFVLNYVPVGFSTDSLYDANAMGVMLAIPFLCILLGTLVVRAGPRLLKVDLKFKDLPKELEGLRILHITDLHISRSLPTRFVEKLVALSKKNPADLVVFTGDILDDIPARYAADIALLKDIPSKHGSFYVPGNHEYYWQGTQTIGAFRNIGFNVLLNEARSLQFGNAELQICGIPDPAAHGFQLEGPDFEKLARALHPSAFKILLSHQPTLADQAAPLGIQLQLSGHTHGGQFFPWNLLIGFFQKYGKGLYHIQNLQLYVNQGTGYWGPSLRLGTYCELAEIRLGRE